MAPLLLDTVTLIYVGRGRLQVLAWLQRARAQGDILGVCPIVVTEILSNARPREVQAIERLVASLEFWPITLEDAVDAGTRRADLRAAGVQTQITDALIAAVARRLGATVVSENVKDFVALGVPVVDPGQ